MSQDLSLNDLSQNNDNYDNVVHFDTNVGYVNNTEPRDVPVHGDDIYIDPIPGPAEAALAAGRVTRRGCGAGGGRQAALVYALCGAVLLLLLLAAALVAGGIMAVSSGLLVCIYFKE